ncbi:hypothetical protein QTP70_005363, partial [Hemibagrus guttatus]
MKSFERLVLAYLKNITGPLLDPLQFAYRANRSVDDAVNMGLHFILQHLDKSGTYASASETGEIQVKQPHHQHCAPQGCVLSPLLFSLYTNDCTSTDPSIKLLKFADDTTVIGLIQDGDESAYRQEIEQLAAWCSRNNLELNTLKTVEMIVDFRRNTPALPPLTIMNSTVPTVASFRFLGTTISQDLKWDTHIDATIKKAQQRLYFLRQLRKFNLPQELLIHFYSAVIESVLCTSITVWFGSATKSDMRRLQRTIEEEFPANSRKKGGAVGRKLDDALDLLNEACTYNNLGLGFRDRSTESRREAVIRGLIFYLGEETEDLIKDHQVQNTPLTLLQVSAPPVQDEVVQSKMADGLAVRCFYTSLHEYTVFEDDDAADVQEALPTFVLNIFVVTRARDGGLHKRAGIAVEGTEELFGYSRCGTCLCVPDGPYLYPGTIEEEFPANSRKKGGAVGRKLDDALDLLNEACTYNNLGLGFRDRSTESRREAVIRGLIFYLGEETEDLIKDHQVQNTPLTLLQVSAPPVQDEVVQSKMADGLAVRCFYTSLHEYTVFEDDDAADVQEALPTFVLNIFVVTRARDGGLHKRAGMAVEGTEELFGIPDVARA